MAKARVLSANQLNKVQPALKPMRNQKDINNLINAAVQEVLLDKTDTKSALSTLSKKVRPYTSFD